MENKFLVNQKELIVQRECYEIEVVGSLPVIKDLTAIESNRRMNESEISPTGSGGAEVSESEQDKRALTWWATFVVTQTRDEMRHWPSCLAQADIDGNLLKVKVNGVVD